LPRFADPPHGLGREALEARHTDDGGDRLADVQRLDERRIAGAEHQRFAVAGERVVEATGAAVRHLLGFEREPVDLGIGEAQAEVLVERPHDRDGHRRRPAETHAAGHLGEYLDLHRPLAKT
jgi:hypothetical protein